MPGFTHAFNTVRRHGKLVASAGALLALAGAGSASAATVASSGPAPLATPTIADITGPTSQIQHLEHSEYLALPGLSAQTPVHHVPGVHQAAHQASQHVAATKNANSWSAVSAVLNRQDNPAAAAHGVVPAADKLTPVAVSGPQSWMQMSPAQYANAKTIVRRALEMKMGVRSAVIAVATAMQESKLLNIDYGTGDSLGLFQQQADMGWGSAKQIMNPAYASSAFLQALRFYQQSNPDWANQPLYQSAQGVQRSGYPYAYAQWESQAAHVTQQVATQLR